MNNPKQPEDKQGSGFPVNVQTQEFRLPTAAEVSKPFGMASEVQVSATEVRIADAVVEEDPLPEEPEEPVLASEPDIPEPTPYAHIFIDLETLDTRPSACVTAIGAYKVDIHGRVIEDSRFLVNVSLIEQILGGRTISASTVKFWNSEKCSDYARLALTENPKSLVDALQMFRNYYNANKAVGRPLVWGNGTIFDNNILNGLYALAGQNSPWFYQQDADWRTLRLIYPRVDDLPFRGVKHNAADDARHEASGLEFLLLNKMIDNPFQDELDEE